MKLQGLIALFVCQGMVGACGGSSSTTPANTPDSGTVTLPPDAAPAVSPFVPAAMDGVITNIIAECEAKGLLAGQKPAIAIMPKDQTGFFLPVIVGANRMGTRLGIMPLVDAPYDPNLDKNAPDALDKAAALQSNAISGYISSKLYKGLALAPHVAAGDLLTVANSFVNTCGPVVTIDSDMPTSLRSYLIATSNYQAGVTAAQKLLEVVKPGESVLVFGTTVETWVSGIERAQGAIDTLKAAGVIVAPKVSPVWTPRK